MNRITLHEYTSSDGLYTLQNGGTISADLIVTIVFLLIWFTCGSILAYWVKIDMKKRNREDNFTIFLIVLTSLIGFTIYIITTHGEVGFLEKIDNFSGIDEFIKNEEETEFQDEIEEIIEEELEDIIDGIIEVPEIRIL